MSQVEVQAALKEIARKRSAVRILDRTAPRSTCGAARCRQKLFREIVRRAASGEVDGYCDL